MTTFIWILWFSLALAIIIILDILFKKKTTLKFKIIYSITKIILSIGLAFLALGGPIFLRPVQPLLIALYAVLLPTGILNLIFSFDNKYPLITKIISYVFAILFLVHGTLTGLSIKEENREYISTKLINEYTFAYMSDVHYGSSQSFETWKEEIETLKTLDLDFVILGGDITDIYTTNDEMKEFYSLFNDFGCPVYFTYGNHDKQNDDSYTNGKTYTISELENTLISNNIYILKDEKIYINNDLVLIGRLDKTDDERLEIVNNDTDKYVISFDHSPFNTDDTKELNGDLQISGHTHAGQFIGLNFLYEPFMGFTKGDYKVENTNVYVSPGASGWRVPFKTYGNNIIEVITIKSA